jgi:hypothetical protein
VAGELRDDDRGLTRAAVISAGKWQPTVTLRCHRIMARKPRPITVTDIQEHHAGCPDCGSHGPFDQEYTVPEEWMAELLGHVAKAHGAKAFVRSQRGAKTTMVLKGHSADVLKRTGVDFLRLLPDLHDAITKTMHEFCTKVPSLVARPPQ